MQFARSHATTKNSPIRFCLFLLLVLSLTLAGCTPPPPSVADVSFDQPVEITFWHTLQREQAQALNSLVDQFNKENGKQITVKAVYQGNSVQLLYKVLAAVNENRSPNMAMIYDQNVSEYMKNGLLVNLDPYFNGTAGFDTANKDDLWATLVDGGRYPQYNHNLLTMPFAQQIVILYYNDALLKASGKDVPQTWDQFIETAQAMTRREEGQTTVYGVGFVTDGAPLEAIMLSRGVRLVSADGTRAGYNEPGGVDALDAMSELVRTGSATVYKTGSTDWETDFIQGKLGMVIADSGARSVFSAQGRKLSWSVTAIPQRDPKAPVTIDTGPRIGIFNSDPLHQAAAWEFIRWFSGRDQTAKWSTGTYFIPLRRSANQVESLKEFWDKHDPAGKDIFDLIKTARGEPNISGWSEARAALEEAAVNVLTGQALSKEALDSAIRRADAALAAAR